MMVSALMVILFGWLFVKSLGFALRLTWGVAKIVGSILLVLALPVLGLCLLFAGSALLIVPVIMVGIALAVMRA